MWNRYHDMAELRAVRDRLGLTAEAWDEQPAVFTDWAVRFHRLEQRRAERG